MTSCTDVVLASCRSAVRVRIGELDPDRIAGELHAVACLADDLAAELLFSPALALAGSFRLCVHCQVLAVKCAGSATKVFRKSHLSMVMTAPMSQPTPPPIKRPIKNAIMCHLSIRAPQFGQYDISATSVSPITDSQPQHEQYPEYSVSSLSCIHFPVLRSTTSAAGSSPIMSAHSKNASAHDVITP